MSELGPIGETIIGERPWARNHGIHPVTFCKRRSCGHLAAVHDEDGCHGDGCDCPAWVSHEADKGA